MTDFLDYFSFDRLITPHVIQLVFWIGAIISVMIGIGALFRLLIGEALVMIFFVPLVWRVVCEVPVMVYRIHEDIGAMRVGTSLKAPPSGDKLPDLDADIRIGR